MLEAIHHEYLQMNPEGNISSALYYEKVLRTKLNMSEDKRWQAKYKRETKSERFDRIVWKGKIYLDD